MKHQHFICSKTVLWHSALFYRHRVKFRVWSLIFPFFLLWHHRYPLFFSIPFPTFSVVGTSTEFSLLQQVYFVVFHFYLEEKTLSPLTYAWKHVLVRGVGAFFFSAFSPLRFLLCYYFVWGVLDERSKMLWTKWIIFLKNQNKNS